MDPAALEELRASWAARVQEGSARPLLASQARGAAAVATGLAAPQPEVTRQEAPRFTLQPFWADMLRDKGDRCVECLRYYYGCYPLTASSRDRALKLIATLRNLQADLHSLRDDMRKVVRVRVRVRVTLTLALALTLTLSLTLICARRRRRVPRGVS